MKKILLTLSVVFMISVFISAQNFLNPSVEHWGLDNFCDVNIAPDSWINYTNAGIGPDETNFFICPTTIPTMASEGNIYARMYAENFSTGEGMIQNVTGFSPGQAYIISYYYSGSNLYPGNGDIQWHLYIDDVDEDQSPIFNSTQASWKEHTYCFISNSFEHKIGFRIQTTTTNIAGSGAIDNFQIVAMTLNLGTDTTLCQGDTLKLDVKIPQASYLWQDSSSNFFFDIVKTGIYWIEINLNNCAKRDTINVDYYALPNIELGNDTSICNGEMLILDAMSIGSSYIWQDSSSYHDFKVTESGKYWVEIENCGVNSDTINIEFNNCNLNLYIPNVFSPNGDNINDLFFPSLYFDYNLYSLMIFDRWGGLQFESSIPNESWDGKNNGKEVPIGVYTYKLIYKNPSMDENIKYGTITLIR